MRKTSILVVSILLVLIVAGIIWGFSNRQLPKENNSANPNKEGKYFDSLGNQIGTCITETKDFTTTTYFYQLDGTLIGSCWSYSGPGSSGAKFGCDSDELLTEPCEGSECGQMEGKKLPKYNCKFE